MNEGMKNPGHTVTICNRQSVLLTGVEDVLNFDEGAVVLATTLGTLAIEGEGLHIKQMNVDSREFGIEGKISSLVYLDKRSRRRGLFHRSGNMEHSR